MLNDFDFAARYRHCVSNYRYCNERSFDYRKDAREWYFKQATMNPMGDGDIAHLSDGTYFAFYGYGNL